MALLFCATTINYVDRQVLGILKPVLQRDLGWSEVDYGTIVFWFQAAYALGLVTAGRAIDAVGTRIGLALAVGFWSVAAMAHAMVGGVAGFGAARFALGVAEAGNFPASIKAVAEWFPRKERALAAGLFNAGSNVGAMTTPILVPAIALTLGWRWAFVLTGALGFVWLAVWIARYRAPEADRGLSAVELAYIRGDPADASSPRVPLAVLVRQPQTWAVALARFLTDPIWWFFLFWLPDFLGKTYGLDLKTFGPPLVAIYLLADVGSIAGGWLSSRLIRRGWSVNAGRKTAMLACALCVVPVVFAASADRMAVAVALIGLAAAAHQGWSANLYTVVSDLFPRSAVASVTGLTGACGAVGGMLMAQVVGHTLERLGGYQTLFAIAASAYLVALAVLHLLAPKMTPVAMTADVGAA